jgi:D-beta-D-heptose 7-phosphate kinase / D-beta-D-heptose 1-phosphate adenosyltransferase
MIEFLKSKPRVLVIGDLMIDHYFWGTSERISPEAPVPVVNVKSESSVLGGAGNVINNLYALGADVEVMSVIGNCDVSIELKNLLSKINIGSEYLEIQNDRITSKKTRIIAAQQQVVRYDIESLSEINKTSQQGILKNYKKLINEFDVILLSDYGKGVLTDNLTKKLISIANQNSKKVLVDPKGLDYSKYNGAYLLTPNKKEASEATNIKIKDDKSLNNAIQLLKEKYKLSISLITLSDQGVAVFDDKLRTHPTAAREVYDVTGAGDTILASIGYAISCNKNIDEAIKFANLAAGVVVGKIGSATATLNEIIEYESNLNKSLSDEHIKTWKEISQIVTELKDKKKKIVFTNGCFDILHIGHIMYLEKAKSFGDILILGLNSDQSVKNLKGDKRPINIQSDRAYLLAALEVVDYVVIFNEQTPLELIKLIEPHTLVKGGDYKNRDVVGSNIAGELKLVEYIDGKSTSTTINRIQNS